YKILSIGIGHREGTPSFTSERFPYTGLSYIRAGWKPTDPYVFMVCSPHPAGGVLSWRNNNAIGLGGFGYDLIETGENGTYDQPHTPVRVDGEEQFFHLGIPTWGHRGAMITATTWQKPAPWRWSDSPQFTVAEGVYSGNFGKTKNIGDVTHQRMLQFVRSAGLWIVTDRLRSPASHDYTLDWRFGIQPGHPTDFTADQIKVQKETNTIKTVRDTGANVSLYQFPSAPLTFTTAEERTPPGGYRLHDFLRVSADWRAQGESVVVTAIYPRDKGADDLTGIQPLHSPGVEGFEATTTGGVHVLYGAAVKAPAHITLGRLSANAESLLLTTSPDGARHGVALGCRSLSYGGKAVPIPTADFEFDLAGDRVAMMPIHTPVDPVQIQPADKELFLGEQPITLTCDTPQTQIRYTLDGTDPTPASPLYKGPFTLTTGATIKARAFRNGTTVVPITVSETEASLPTRAVFRTGTLADPVAAPATTPGLHYDYYEARWQDLLTDFDRQTPVKSGQVPSLFDVSPKGAATTYAFKYSGFLDAPADGVYTFYAPPEFYQPNIMAAYDLRVFVDGNEWYPGTDRHALGAWSTALRKGKHAFTVIYEDLRADGPQKMNKPGQAPVVWTGVTPALQLAGPGLPRGPVPAGMLSAGK
ncbi:MAG: chitobiase/beta-hexosaminidase C-terminal domain-containing protein, partial [Armatimonadota bacterium]|nr:chitobiase/beta-hexosaminidase C-terminal domain-containing protein [Armatimonadota bacterium]